jgi:hypothetical protein
MAHPAVIDAIEARLAAGFTECPIHSENTMSSTPGDGSPFLVVQFPFARSTWATIDGPDGSDFEEEGAVRFILFVERGAGAQQGRQWLEKVASIFRGAVFDNVQCFAPDSPVADDRNEDGVYYALSMACPYEFTISQ